MKPQEYKVHFETVTPLRFGDAWLENKAPFKTSSIIGSLRFWFEIICYLSGITKPYDYTINTHDRYGKADKIHKHKYNVILKADLKQKEFRDELIKLIETSEKDCSTDDLTIELLEKMKIPLPARVFGCTGWQGLIKIKKVEISKIQRNQSYEIFTSNTNPQNLILRNNEHLYQSNSKRSDNYIRDYFYGYFDVIFSTDKNTAQHILFPLLKFIECYGFIGGAWNLGYGRVKVSFDKAEVEYNKFSDYAEFSNNPVSIDDLVENVDREIDLLKNKKINNKLRLFIRNDSKDFHGETVNYLLKELKKEKIYIRRHRYNMGKYEKYYQVFGSKSLPVHGSKVLPWVREANNEEKKWEYGLISIIDILNIGEGDNGKNEF
ncbi:MAG: type III-B CRISPR module RAMP protein Cmr1 [Clostridiaceae bacterium]|nr:type III-B CRISPR module RAMP protein Cmr1 [Clostridiaceae bacterium]